MKVWHVTKSLHGGAGIYAQRLSEALRSAGIDSCVLSADFSRTDRKPELRSDAGVVPWLVNRIIRSLSHRLTSAPFQSLMGPERYEGSDAPAQGDIIHLHGLTGWMGVRGLNALIPDGSPVFWTTHDLWPLSGGCILYAGCQGYRSRCGSCPILQKGTKGWAKIELRLKEKFIRENRIQPIANSSWMASHIQESRVFKGANNIPVIPPIVDPAYLAPDIEDMREKLQIASGKRVISLGARAVTDRYKGIPEFLGALAKRPRMAEQCVVVLFGEGELDLPDNLDVRSLGRLESAEKIAQVYYSSDVFVSPSAMETFGMALAEAQACGTPVAAFDVGGVRDAVSEECARFLVPEGDMDGLLNAVGQVFVESAQADKEWRMSRDWARQRFEASVIGAKQMAVYAQHDCQLK